MGVVGLAWYLSGVSALLALMFSAITYAPPGPGPLAQALPVVFAGGSLVAAVVALALGRLPATHRARQSRPLWAAFVVVAVSVTLLGVLLG